MKELVSHVRNRCGYERLSVQTFAIGYSIMFNMGGYLGKQSHMQWIDTTEGHFW